VPSNGGIKNRGNPYIIRIYAVFHTSRVVDRSSGIRKQAEIGQYSDVGMPKLIRKRYPIDFGDEICTHGDPPRRGRIIF
jgi:hypothetical protein